MAREILADTSGLYALLVAADDCHGAACALLKSAAAQATRFVLTDYVLDETATLLRARGHRAAARDLFDAIVASSACRVEWMTAERFDKTKVFFLRHADQPWSFTDCFSFVLMRELRISEALTKDSHFAAAGFSVLLAPAA